jgi:DNA polymerase
MTDKGQLEKTLGNVELFLKQQAELFGEEMFLTEARHGSDSIRKDESGPTEVIREHQAERKTGPIIPAETSQGESKSKPRTIKVTEDRGLFDGAVPTMSGWKIDPHWYDSTSLDELDSSTNKCQKCVLGSTRKNFVFGVGHSKAKLVLIGEAPGADEDEQGEPFVGRAGQLLNKILAAVQLRREDVYICNILKCRPPNNRDPLPEEIEACEPYLKKQLEIIKPKLIVCLGRIAGQSLLKINTSLAEFRNSIYEYQGIKVLVTYHPAALLRNPNWKRPAWEDIQKMRKLYDELL